MPPERAEHATDAVFPRQVRIGPLRAPGPDRALRRGRSAVRAQPLRRDERGGAQLYITGESNRATVANNVFVGTDPRVPSYHSRVGLLVGGSGGGPIPYFVRILHNKIYTGARRADGYAGSISISPGYHWRVPVGARPVIAHNVIGLLRTPVRLCNGAKMVANVILRGRGCSK